MSKGLTDPRPIEQYLLTLALLLISAMLVYSQAAKRLDLLIYDTFINVNTAPIDTQTVIVSIDEKSLTSLFSLPFAACTEIVYMIYNRLNKFSSLAIYSLITWRTSVLLGASRFQLGFHNKYSKKWCLCLHD